MEFIAGAVVGFVIAALIGRAKFLKIQNTLREVSVDLIRQLETERNLNEGLTQTLDAVASKSRLKAV